MAALVERNNDIISRYREGLTLEEVGKKYGLSRQRVHQIIKVFAPEVLEERRAGRRKEE